MSKIFLSHSSQDKVFARRLAAELRMDGHTVWIDEAEINVGDSLITKIRDGIDNVDFVAAILSKTSVRSEWVKKELEIASNREIKEKRVVVLPVLIDKVPLPGFLEGKLYADFTNTRNYKKQMELLKRSLGDTRPILERTPDSKEAILEELQAVKAIAEHHKSTIKKISEHNFKEKSPELQKAIKEDNKMNPEYAPINNVYAFEASFRGSKPAPVTLGYLFHAMRKATLTGSHILEVLLTDSNKWANVERMLDAYEDMILSQKKNKSKTGS